MTRHEIISKIGKDFFASNIENDEFSYLQALQIINRKKYSHYKIDIRFEKGNLSVLVETKNNNHKHFTTEEIEQIQQYCELERMYKRNNNIVCILYNLKNENIKIWKGNDELIGEKTINPISYYENLFNSRTNDKNKVIETTNELNVLLHSYGISEKLRSQFVGSLLVALNNGLQYDSNLTNKEIRERIKEKLNQKIENNENKKKKTELLVKILDKQDIRELKSQQFVDILRVIHTKLIPYIDPNNSQGNDLLNLFFTTFNKYVGKADKNQAFTPTHITDFMCDIVEINQNSIVLDPTCGSGSFLVQAMSKMLSKAQGDSVKQKNIKSQQIFGIEKFDAPFGLATTNMMIHEDGKSNIIQGSCFDQKEWIQNNQINTILMNPPFNGQKMPHDCPTTKKGVDATKGLYFVKYIADVVNKGLLATILPLQCAIGSGNESINEYKRKMLKNHTLKAVFSLPDDVFYPGANVNTCIMLFELGIPHSDRNQETFFGYYKDDGFIKKKNMGRVEKRNWEKIKKVWLDLYKHKQNKPGLSINKKVSYDDEWLAEAYIETDYSTLNDINFKQTIRDFIAYKVKNGETDD